jgi:butyrate response factor 1
MSNLAQGPSSAPTASSTTGSDSSDSYISFNTIRSVDKTDNSIVNKEPVVTLSTDQHYEDVALNKTSPSNKKKKKNKTSHKKNTTPKKNSNHTNNNTTITKQSCSINHQSTDTKEEKQLQEDVIMLRNLPMFDSGATHKRIMATDGLNFEPRLSKSSVEYHNNRISVKNGSPRKGNTPSDKYKTELCRPYLETRHCKYGSRCRYAHGKKELKTVNRHPNFRTVLCLPYHYEGVCTYGVRCCYIHNADEEVVGRMAAENIDLVDHYQRCDRLPIFKFICDKYSQELPEISKCISEEAQLLSELRMRGTEPTLY